MYRLVNGLPLLSGNVDLLDVGGEPRIQYRTIRRNPTRVAAHEADPAQRLQAMAWVRYAERSGAAFMRQGFARVRWMGTWGDRVGFDLLLRAQSNEFLRLRDPRRVPPTRERGGLGRKRLPVRFQPGQVEPWRNRARQNDRAPVNPLPCTPPRSRWRMRAHPAYGVRATTVRELARRARTERDGTPRSRLDAFFLGTTLNVLFDRRPPAESRRRKSAPSLPSATHADRFRTFDHRREVFRTADACKVVSSGRART